MFPLSLHHPQDDTAVTTDQAHRQQQRLRKSRSYNVVAPLVGLVRDPVGSVGGVLSGLGQWQQGASETKELQEKKRKEDAESEAKRQVLYLRMKEADSYNKWYAAAIALDALEGNDAWKSDTPSSSASSKSYYNAALISHRLLQLDEARLNCDARRMLFLVRTALSRNLGGMNNMRLYRHSHVGTKVLIEKYIESALTTLKSLLEICATQAKRKDGNDEKLDRRFVLEQLLAARQAFGRSALLLSGGGTFGMNHIGVVKCLWEQNLLPRIISGASAGSIVCAVLCTRPDAEIPSMLEYMCSGDIAVFEDPEEREKDGLMGVLRRFLTHGAVFESKHLVRVMRGLLGDITFQEAYNRTRRILNICVSSASLYELPRLLNYVTAPNVIVWSAVATSCSVPLVFTPSSILAKDPKTGAHLPWNGPSPSLTQQRWIDGSVDNDLPMTRLAEMFNVNHFIVSQVNPHVVPFLRSEEGAGAEALTTDGGDSRAGKSWLNTVTMLAKGELLHRMHVLADMHIFPTTLTKARSILSQRYSGDITILPEIPYSQFPLVLSNPTPEFMLGAMKAGERATWPKLSRIRNALSIEMALDEAVGEARGRVVFSKSQVDLRIGAFGRVGMEGGRAGRGRGRPKDEQWRHSSGARLEESSDVGKITKKSRNSTRMRSKKQPPQHISLPKVKVTPEGILSSSSATVDDDLTDSDTKKHANIFALSSSPLSSPETSSTDLDNSDIDAMNLNGPRTAVPELWPTTRQLFPSSSQPATPYNITRNGSQSLLSTTSLTMTAASENSPSPATLKKASTVATQPQQVPRMRPSTPPSKQSEPERRYKRLFHARPSHDEQHIPTRPVSTHVHTPPLLGSMLSMTSMNDPQAPDGAKGGRRKSLGSGTANEPFPTLVSPTIPVDISGTRGMLLRKKSQRKRSLSTGLQGLAPPGPR